MFPTTHVFTFATTAPPWGVWSALTDAAASQRYLDGIALKSTWAAGDFIAVEHEGVVVGAGEVLAADAWDRLAYAFEGGDGADTYVTWSIRNIPTGSIVRLYVDEMDGERDDDVEDAWLPVLRRLQEVLVEGQNAQRTAAG